MQPDHETVWETSAFETLEPRMMLAGDHPSLIDLPTATTINLTIRHDIGSIIGQSDGDIEQVGDDDLFTFVSPASTRGSIVVAQRSVGGLAPAIRLYDDNGYALTTLADGRNGIASVGGVVTMNYIANHRYFIDVQAGDPSDTNEPQLFGQYVVVIVMEEPQESHGGGGDGGGGDPLPTPPAPIMLDRGTGEGSSLGFISGHDDSQDFEIFSLAPGRINVHLTTPGSALDPHLQIINTAGAVIIDQLGDENEIFATFESASIGERFTIRVLPDPAATPLTESGSFQLDIDVETGARPAPPPARPMPTDDEFASASPLGLELASGGASQLDSIIGPNDTDLFRFRAIGTGNASVILERDRSSLLTGTVIVYNAAHQVVAQETRGNSDRLADFSFPAVSGSDYYIWVKQSGGGETGAYTLRLQSPLQQYFAYYPEGYSTRTVNEYVPMFNPNDVPVSYTVIARYEVGERDQTIATGTIGAHDRGGITVFSNNTPGVWPIRQDTPYALEIRSSGLLTATLSHYDFGVTTGENFTTRAQNSWAFAEAHRDASTYRDFLVYYNPTSSAATVRFTLVYSDGTTSTFTRTLDALRRGGINFTTDSAITRDGAFSVQIDSDQPLVAALSSYDIAHQRGFGLLGTAERGATSGAIPVFAGSPGARPSLAIFNPTGATTTVSLTLFRIGVTPAEVTQTVTVPANTRRTLTSAELGLTDNVLASLRYSSLIPVVVSASEYQSGDGDATSAATVGATSLAIADAFVNPQFAGTLYTELLSTYNPTSSPAHITISLLRTDNNPGILDTVSLTIPSHQFGFVRIDQLPGVLHAGSPVAFSVRIDSDRVVAAEFTHYDLYLHGGWSTIAAPLGLTTPFNQL